MAMNSETPMTIAFLLSAASVAWAAVFAWTRWLVRPRPDSVLASQDYEYRLEQRLERIEHAIHAIGMEVERLAEGQRLTTQLLTAHVLPAGAKLNPPPLSKRIDTPH